MSSQYGELRPTSSSHRFGSLGHPSKFKLVSCLGFVTAVTLLTGGQPDCARCLAVSWARHDIYIFVGCSPLTEFCLVHNSLYVQVLRSPIVAALLHGTAAADVVCSMVQGMELPNFCRQRHLYSAEWPSRWTSAHILVFVFTVFVTSLILFIHEIFTRCTTLAFHCD